jgi:hypothetical protein
MIPSDGIIIHYISNVLATVTTNNFFRKLTLNIECLQRFRESLEAFLATSFFEFSSSQACVFHLGKKWTSK